MKLKAKAKQEAIARGEPLPVVEKRKPGRPKGSLNKKTIAAMEAKAKAEQEAIARGEPLPVVENVSLADLRAAKYVNFLKNVNDILE